MGAIVIKSKIFFSVLVLFVLLGVSFASAADNNQTGMVSFESDDSINEEGNDFTTLNEEIINCSGGELKLTKNYSYDNSTDDFKDGIKITRDDFTVDGQGHTIDAKGFSRIFDVTGTRVCLKNINFINVNCSGAGAVNFHYMATVENCNFTNNTALSGSAIYSNYVLTAVGCRFENNSATSYGGAVFCGYSLTLQGCWFENNSAARDGGAVYLDSDNPISVDGCVFINNDAQAYGGAVFMRNGTVENSLFFKNNAENGGAVYILRKLSVISNSTFNNNSARSHGGAINSLNYATVIRSSFNGNHAVCAGAIYFENNGHVKECNFTANTGTDTNGGAIQFRYSNGIVEDSNFNASSTLAGGGAICFFETGSLSNCNFSNNNAGQAGGAVYASGKTTVKNCNFDNNSAGSSYGGAVYIENGGEIINCSFSNNSALEGGAVYLKYDGLVDDCNFTCNFVTERLYGGAVYVAERGCVNNSRFACNRASYGGAIYIKNSAAVNGSVFKGNNASLGGAIYIAENATIDNCNFTANNAFDDGYTGYGGAIYSASQPLIITNSNFRQNNATRGGAIYSGKNLTVIYGNFEANSAAEGTNNIALAYGARVCLINVTPENIGPFYFVNVKIINQLYFLYGNDAIIKTEVTFEGKPLNEGNVSVTINNKTYTQKVEGGNATLAIPDLKAGSHDINVTYQSDYYVAWTSDLIYIEKRYVNFEDVEVENVKYGETVQIGVRLTSMGDPVNWGNVSVTIGEHIFSADMENGVANISIPKLNAGLYNATVIYDGGENYTNPSVYIQFNVEKLEVSMEIMELENVTFPDTVFIKVSVTSHYEVMNLGNVSIEISGKDYSANVKNNIAVIEIPGLNAGIYRGSVRFSGASYYNPCEVNVTFKVRPKLVDIAALANNVTYGDAVKIHVNVTLNGTSINEGNVSVVINGKTYTAFVENGTAVIEIPRPDAGNYNLTIAYESVNYYVHHHAIEFTVFKQSSTMAASNNAYVINYGGAYSITLRDAPGNPLSGKKVTFTLNGRVIGSAVSNDRGVAAIKLTPNMLKTAKAGSKNLAVKFDGDINYNGVAKTVKITVNKEKTKIVAKKKTFRKALKVKKYAVTLKDSKGKGIKKVRVTLKVKGKTYKAKTNSRGKAVFKIKKLSKKGKYSGTVKFKGNSYYKPVTKKVKITVKK